MSDLLENAYREAYNNWKATDSIESRNAILEKLMPIINQSIYGAGGDSTNPVIQAKAKLLALQGLKRYDPKKAALRNYMYSHMRGLYRVFGNDNNIIQTPESVVLDRKKLSAMEHELFDELGRYPSTRELADRTGLSLKRIAKVRSASVPVTEQQIDTVFGESGAPAVIRLGDTDRQSAWIDYVYDSVDDRQKAIMERIYGLNGFKPMAAKDIAKELKVTPAAISQQRKKIDSLLNSELQGVAFGGLYE